MELKFLVLTVGRGESNNETWEIISIDVDELGCNRDCNKYFKGDMNKLLKCLPDIIDDDAENIRDGIITDQDPCSVCGKPACTKRNKFVIPDEESVDEIFMTHLESKKDGISAYVEEY